MAALLCKPDCVSYLQQEELILILGNYPIVDNRVVANTLIAGSARALVIREE